VQSNSTQIRGTEADPHNSAPTIHLSESLRLNPFESWGLNLSEALGLNLSEALKLNLSE
jgi:hypothetical protein